MIFQIRIRYLLIVAVFVTLVKAYKLNYQSPGSASSETANETVEDLNNIGSENFTESWIWLPRNTNDPEILADEERSHQEDEQGMNWCLHVGAPFEKGNFSRFQLTNECCKDHFKSVLVEINHDRRYKCKVEKIFLSCLKLVNTKMSRYIGDYYFNKVPPPTCYEVEETKHCHGSLCGSVIMKISANTPLPAF